MYSQVQEGAAEPGPDGEAVTPIAAEAAPAGEAAPPVARRPSPLDSLKAEIARAMQNAAERERERIDAGFGEEETVQVEKIFTRAAAEAAELSKHADDDVSVVNAWYKDQIKRLRAEADRQIDERRMRLEESLTHHGSLIEAEIESVHLAVAGYRASLGAFFDRLAGERDPSAIARLAGDLPEPPDLDDVRAEARSDAMHALAQETEAETPQPSDRGSSDGGGMTGSERELVPVMDPDSVKQPAGIADAAPMGADVAASADALSSEGNVAVRVIRAFTHRAPSNGAIED